MEENNNSITFTKEQFQKIFIDFKRLMTFYECALLEVETKFKVLNQEFSNINNRNPIESIKTRIKSMESITYKIQRKGLSLNIETVEQSINDVAGIRIVCSFIDDVYSLAQSFSKQDDIKVLKVKDYISNPKPNGYRSLHMIVEVPIFLLNEKKYIKVEVQLRTIAMDSWAALEHQLFYKKELIDDNIDDELFKCALMSEKLDYTMNMLKRKIHLDERK